MNVKKACNNSKKNTDNKNSVKEKRQKEKYT